MTEDKDNYTDLTHIEHVYKRPDLYIGSVENEYKDVYLYNNESDGIITKNMLYNDGFMRIHMELIYNAIDNISRSKERNLICDNIKIEIDKNTNIFSIINNGLGIPIEKKADKYIIENIFSNLMSSSNYDDSKDRFTTGRNGLGSKLTNIFSKFFEVECIDTENELIYIQQFHNNMSIIDKPIIKKSKNKKNYVKVSFIPDFSYFNLDKFYNNDIINYFHKICLDIAGTSLINIEFNKQKIKFKSFLDYCKLYNINLEKEFINIKHNKIDLLNDYESNIIISPNYSSDPIIISFVNDLNTTDGGKHVALWQEFILNKICDKLSKKNNIVTIKDIKKFFNIFISCKIKNPTFTSQSKHKLSGNKELVSLSCDNLLINKIFKWLIINNIKNYLENKGDDILKKAIDSKKRFIKIEGYDSANKAGTKYSKYCSLLLCEGLSAKTYAVVGSKYMQSYIDNYHFDIKNMGEKDIKNLKGRDWIGIYPLRGKCLNTRNATNDQIIKNKEITDIIQILGLEKNIDYTIKENFDKLPYGRITILTDSDVDGLHIKGLLLNMIHYLYKSILTISPTFITSMNTPILKLTLKTNKNILFYNERLAIKYIDKFNKDIKDIKYYKGLGTSNNEDIKNTFAKSIEFINYDDKTDETMDILFNKKKKYADERKELIENYNININDDILNSINTNIQKTKDTIILIKKPNNIKISDFLTNDLIEYSISNCKRSIPNAIDGLKESQRKILFGTFLKNLNYNSKSIKVAQLAGYISEKTNYHHGEQNLCDTIIKMAHDFVGSNNIPLLFRDGQFGSRLKGGDDAASARYIFTKLDKYTRLIFNINDDNILTHVIDDGDTVEPHFYVPIIPMILINGTKGIGTGYSTDIPSFNIFDIINYILNWVKTDEYDDNMQINPWYNNFKGTILKYNDTKWTTNGIYSFNNIKNIINIYEIPVNVWIDNFKEGLDKLIESKNIISYKNFSTENIASFDIKVKNSDVISNNNINSIINNTSSSLNISNMTLFDIDNNLKKFKDIYAIIKYYCGIRLDFYNKRKNYLINILNNDLIKLNNKYRFIKHIIDDNTIIFKKTNDQVIKLLTTLNYDKIDDSYDYLLNMPVKSFTSELLDKLKKSSESKCLELNKLTKITIKNLWISDLINLRDLLNNDSNIN
tara:strand:- start:230 stop:3688 length:3459 start_codon:yes stop_codon:yes gene_type:complete